MEKTGKKLLKHKPVKSASTGGSGIDKLKRILDGLGGEGKWWKPKLGKNTIRVLPEGDYPEFYYHSILHYGFKDEEGGRAYPCLSAFNKPCPVCKLISKISMEQDPDVQAVASRLKPRHSFLMNIIDRSNPDKGVLVYSAPKGVMNEIITYLTDTEYGDITNVEEGYDFKIDRTGEGLQTRYSVRISARPSPLNVDDWEENLNDLKNLAYREIPTEKQYITLLEDNFGDIVDVSKLLKSITPSKKVKAKVEEEEELENTDEEEEEDE